MGRIMKIAKLCRPQVVIVEATASLAEAAALMQQHHVGALVVVAASPEGAQVRGMLTDRDLAIHALAQGLDAGTVLVGELAQHPVNSVPADEDSSHAIALMQAAGVRRLLVTDSSQHLVGVVSLDDLLAACAADLAGLAGVLRRGLEREATAPVAAKAPAPLPPLRVPAMGTAGWALKGSTLGA
jgi:CBS domain-containing protein